MPKEHWIDAICIGNVKNKPKIPKYLRVLKIKAYGHGRRQRANVNKYGIAIGHGPRQKFSHGWKTGDIGKAIIPPKKYKGKTYGQKTIYGRIVVRFKRTTFRIGLYETNVKHLVKKLHMADGYGYSF